jgi:hypothetical protein
MACQQRDFECQVVVRLSAWNSTSVRSPAFISAFAGLRRQPAASSSAGYSISRASVFGAIRR